MNILKKIEDYFDMEIQATRFNWYENSDHWKPFHHDAAALKPNMAKKQNFTVSISFGAERDVAFEHAKNGCKISFPLSNGSAYVFTKDINKYWRHGILQLPREDERGGRISIVAWGWVNQTDV